MRHIICVLVENKFGVLAHVAGLFSARGFNITSLAVGETQDPSVSRMTIVVKGDDRTLEQIKKQLNKLIDIIKVFDLTGKEFVDRELLLMKVKVSGKNKNDVIKIVEKAGGVIIATKATETLMVEAVGDQDKICSLLEKLNPYGIVELIRTGRIAIATKDKKEKE